MRAQPIEGPGKDWMQVPKEYRTIREVAGPLMMIGGVENVKYNELGEIALPSG